MNPVTQAIEHLEQRRVPVPPEKPPWAILLAAALVALGLVLMAAGCGVQGGTRRSTLGGEQCTYGAHREASTGWIAVGPCPAQVTVPCCQYDGVRCVRDSQRCGQ